MHPTAVGSAWIAIAAAGFSFSCAVLPRYFLAWRKARRKLPPADRVAGVNLMREYLRGESMRCICHTVSIALGVWALFIPPAPASRFTPDTPWYIRDFGGVFVAGLVIINVCTMVNSMGAYLSWRRRFGT